MKPTDSSGQTALPACAGTSPAVRFAPRAASRRSARRYGRRALAAAPTWPSWNQLAAIGAIYTLLMCGYVAWRAERSTDFRDFWSNAREFLYTGRVLSGKPAEAPSRTTADDPVPEPVSALPPVPAAHAEPSPGRFEGVHNYLPFFTLFMAPWGWLPLTTAIILFTAFSLALFATAVVLLDVLVQGRLAERPSMVTLLALALAAPYVHACVTVGAVTLLLVFLIVAAWYLLEERLPVMAGVALGLATLIKLLPGALLAYLLLRREWRAAGLGLGTVVVLGGGLSLVCLGAADALAAHQEFWTSARAHSALATISAEKPEKSKYNNNALPIVLRRLFSPVDGNPQVGRPPLLVNLIDAPRPAIALGYVALLGVIVSVSIFVALRAAPGPALATWCMVMLLASPLVWTHYFPLALPALVVLLLYGQTARAAAVELVGLIRAERAALGSAELSELAKYDRAKSVSTTGAEPGAAGRAANLFAELRLHQRIERIVLVAVGAWLLGIVLLAWPAARACGAQLGATFAVWAALVAITSLSGGSKFSGGSNRAP